MIVKNISLNQRRQRRAADKHRRVLPPEQIRARAVHLTGYIHDARATGTLQRELTRQASHAMTDYIADVAARAWMVQIS